MSVLPTTRYITPEEYLEEEESSPFKREYVQGEVYAMAGASDAHGTIAFNLAALVRNRLRGTAYRGYVADMKVYVDATNMFYHPDVVVSCDERDRAFRKFKRHPSMVVEVLSDSTEAFDRDLKFQHYSQIDTLQEYVLISQHRVEVEVRRRDAHGEWTHYYYGADDTIRLESIALESPIEELYDNVLFGQGENAVNEYVSR